MRRKRSVIWKITVEELTSLINKSSTISQVLSYFGLKNKGGNSRTLKARCLVDHIDLSKFADNINKGNLRPAIPLEKILIAQSNYNRGQLKQRLIKDGKLQNICSECGLKPEWCGKKLIMILDHINGVSNDNRITNLRLLCPNCNSQSNTFAGRNTKIRKPIYYCNCGKRKTKSALKCNKCYSKSRPTKCPVKNILKKLLWKMPSTIIAQKYKVSDKTIAKWAKKYGLAKPSRGYWTGNKGEI
jgi:hypothetical protein